MSPPVNFHDQKIELTIRVEHEKVRFNSIFKGLHCHWVHHFRAHLPLDISFVASLPTLPNRIKLSPSKYSMINNMVRIRKLNNII